MQVHYSKPRTNTTTQKRKHYTQMTIHEKRRCVRMIRDSHKVFGRFDVTPHASQKLYKGKIPLKTFFQLLYTDEMIEHVIEYNVRQFKDFEDERVLVRIPYKIDMPHIKSSHMFIVISIIQGAIITAYYNELNDNHETINMKNYDKNLEIW